MRDKCAGLGNQGCDVVLVKGAFNLEEPQGLGFLNEKQMGSRWGAMGRDRNEEISLRATSDQGGWILLQQGGFQVSKGN